MPGDLEWRQSTATTKQHLNYHLRKIICLGLCPAGPHRQPSTCACHAQIRGTRYRPFVSGSRQVVRRLFFGMEFEFGKNALHAIRAYESTLVCGSVLRHLESQSILSFRQLSVQNITPLLFLMANLKFSRERLAHAFFDSPILNVELHTWHEPSASFSISARLSFVIGR